MVSNTRKKINGGKYIAEGTYGCVFGNPPLKCEDEDKRTSEDLVSKLMDRDSAFEEIKEGLKWNAVDPKQEFSLTPSKKCIIDNENIKLSNGLYKCDVHYKNSLNSRFLVFYKNGGPDLQKLNPLSTNYENIFSGFQNLFDGLAIAHKNNLVHTDIKPPNILSGVNADHLRFIDFGLSFETKHIESIDEMYSNNETFYPYWPFELGCFFKNGELRSEAYVHTRYRAFNQRFNAQIIKAGLTKFMIPYKTLYDIYEKTNFHDFKNVFEKVDVYSMGITLIDLLRKYFHHYPFQHIDGKQYLFYYDYETDSYSQFTTLKDKKWLSEKQLSYQLYLLENVTRPLMDFISHCVDYNPNTRYTAQEAADNYRKLLPNFKKYLKHNEIRKGLAGLHILNEEYDLPIIPTPVKEASPVKEPSPVKELIKEPSPNKPSPNKTTSKKATSKPSVPKANIKISPVSSLEASPVKPKPKRRITRKIKNVTIIPTTKAQLIDIYNKTSYYVKEDDLLVKIALSLGSRKNFNGRTRIAVYNDIIEKGKARGITFI